MIEIVVLAMLAGFIALRLVSVLGRRTGHEEPAGEIVRRTPAEQQTPPRAGSYDLPPAAPLELPADMSPALKESLTAIAAADPTFDPARFTEGAKAAYRMVLEAFWKGDAEALRDLVSDEIADQFAEAIAARKAEGLTLENRLVSLEKVEIVAAQLRGAMAEVSLRFDADLVAVTRDKAGNVVSGSLSDAVQSHDIWTFSRHTGAADPNWLLIDTDEDA
nr:Tim44/TimA family putative adaptor protein [Sphingosinicella microcystinivorans]